MEGTEEFDLEVLTLPDGIILSQSAALKLCTVKIIDTTSKLYVVAICIFC